MREVCRLEYALPGYTFLHDFALTPTHYVLIQNPVAMDPAPFMLGKISAASSIRFVDGQPAEVHLVRRPIDGSNTQSAKVRVFSGHSSHQNNSGQQCGPACSA